MVCAIAHLLLSFSTSGHNRSTSSPKNGRISVSQVGRHLLAFWGGGGGGTEMLFHQRQTHSMMHFSRRPVFVLRKGSHYKVYTSKAKPSSKKCSIARERDVTQYWSNTHTFGRILLKLRLDSSHQGKCAKDNEFSIFGTEKCDLPYARK